MSDTHNQKASVGHIVDYCNDFNFDLLLHAGDFMHPNILKKFKEFNGFFCGVLGNHDTEFMADYILMMDNDKVDKSRFWLAPEILLVNVGGIRIFMNHGDKINGIDTKRDERKDSYWKNPEYNPARLLGYPRTKYDIFVMGHTHIPDIRQINSGKSMFLNPGKSCLEYPERMKMFKHYNDAEKFSCRVITFTVDKQKIKSLGFLML